jgi:hypothetical protein
MAMRTGVVFCSVLSSPKAGSGLVGSLLVSLLVFELELSSLLDLEANDFGDLDIDMWRLDCFGLNILEDLGLPSLDPSCSLDLLYASDFDDFGLDLWWCFSFSSFELNGMEDLEDFSFNEILEDLDDFFDPSIAEPNNALEDGLWPLDLEVRDLDDLDFVGDAVASYSSNLELNDLEVGELFSLETDLDNLEFDSEGFEGASLEDRGWYAFRGGGLNDVCFASSRWEPASFKVGGDIVVTGKD